jgi:hypothetical protein
MMMTSSIHIRGCFDLDRCCEMISTACFIVLSFDVVWYSFIQTNPVRNLRLSVLECVIVSILCPSSGCDKCCNIRWIIAVQSHLDSASIIAHLIKSVSSCSRRNKPSFELIYLMITLINWYFNGKS